MPCSEPFRGSSTFNGGVSKIPLWPWRPEAIWLLGFLSSCFWVDGKRRCCVHKHVSTYACVCCFPRMLESINVCSYFQTPGLALVIPSILLLSPHPLPMSGNGGTITVHVLLLCSKKTTFQDQWQLSSTPFLAKVPTLQPLLISLRNMCAAHN